jgi:hypothetical protein
MAADLINLGNTVADAATRIGGGVQAIAGTREVLFGIGALPFGPPGLIVGGVAIVHGLDNVQAGLRTAITGVPTQTFTAQGISTIAQAAGVSEGWANTVGLGIDIGAGIASTWGASAIGAAGRNARIFGALKSETDLLYAKLGPARLSHPEEYADIFSALEEAGVEIEFRAGSYAYQPGTSAGNPGKFIIDPDASIGALHHEFQHFKDIRDAGYPGLRALMEDPKVAARLEVRGYQQEINLAREFEYHDLVPAIILQMRDRVRELMGL